MWLIFVEAGIALFLIIFIVWWTMFSGRKPDDIAHREAPPDNRPPE